MLFIGSGRNQGQERVLLMAAGPAFAVDALVAVYQRTADNVAFPSPCSGELDQLHIRAVEVHAEG
ncbi:hypothetical protein D3C72_2341120 [compost metagenome]